jgi:hypothetical protein
MIGAVCSLVLSAGLVRSARAAATDDCGSAPWVVSIPFGDTTNVSGYTDMGDPQTSCGTYVYDHGAWYKFTAPAAGDYAVTTRGTDYDHVLAVFSGTCGALTELACVASNIPTKVVFVTLTAGQTIYLMVGGHFGQTNHLLAISIDRPHDTVVLPQGPIKVVIPKGKTQVTKRVSFKVRNVDTGEPGGHLVDAAMSWDVCSGLTFSQPDFDLTTPGIQSTVLLPGGKTKTAVSYVTFDAASFYTPNPLLPARCLLIPSARARTSQGYATGDPNRNDSLLITVDIINKNPTHTPTPLPPTPTATPTPDVKRIFVTRDPHTSSFGGLTGADAYCESQAALAGLPGAYKAWMSDDTMSAASRLTHASVPYVRVDWVQVAANWADLTDGVLDNEILLDQFGQPSGGKCFTGTTADGASVVGANCNNWTTDSSSFSYVYGSPSAVTATWSQNFGTPACGTYGGAGVYCVQQ